MAALFRGRILASAGNDGRGLVRTTLSPYFERLDDQAIRCTLCPKHCRLSAGERGRCRVRQNRGGECISLVYGNPCLIQLDPIERKPFYHVLPGSRSLSVATAGCNLHCKFCEVWDTALAYPEEVFAYDMPPSKVVEHAVGTDVQSMAFTYGEPVVFFEYMVGIAKIARSKGLLNLFHSNGYIEPKPLAALMTLLDGANIDLKAFDEDTYRTLCDGELAPVLRTLKALKKANIHLEITHLIIPSITDDLTRFGEMCRWIRDELGADVPLHLSRFYPLFKLANLPPTPIATLDKARSVALESGIKYVYVNKVPGHDGEDTMCPQCGRLVIERIGFVVEAVRLNEGACEHCGHRLPGVWSRK